jgi:deoxycytidylate deaminase
MVSDVIVIGFTGAFGSGCTTAAKYLRDNRRFKLLPLSDALKTLWNKKHRGEQYTRHDLQKLGDTLRKDRYTGVLVDMALKSRPKSARRIVIDGIRNLGEVQRLRDLFGYRFTLISVLSKDEARWDRISSKYTDAGLTRDDFRDDDERDRNEETPYGQQVELCLDKADILVNNTGNVSISDFKNRVLDYADLVLGTKHRGATQQETIMHMAFSASHSSKCLKRHVGAVIVDSVGQIVGVGYNENPRGTRPCVEEPTYSGQCYRDILRNDHFEDLRKRGVRCPRCGAPLPKQQGPPWRCGECSDREQRTNLESFFFPDRAMSWCTAVHAEVSAILAAGEKARGGTLYVTTFPCFQCAEKLVQTGIKTVYFTEAYPDPHSGKRLELSGVELRQFEGVRSASFERFFPRPT